MYRAISLAIFVLHPDLVYLLVVTFAFMIKPIVSTKMCRFLPLTFLFAS